MKIITTLSHFSTIHTGDEIRHPVYGLLRVDCIDKIDDDCRMTCSLLDFNNTIMMFDAMDMIRIKYGRKTMLKVLK